MTQETITMTPKELARYGIIKRLLAPLEIKFLTGLAREINGSQASK